MSFNPLAASKHIRQRYLSFIETTYSIKDPEFARLFREEFERDEFVKGPYLEAMPPYKSGASIEKLIDASILSRHFAPGEKGICTHGHETDALVYSRSLYAHQEAAIRHAIAGKNMIVSTGTGSGKTETFLIPIINHLLREKEAGTLATPGIRALLLYPMNALANDQMKRLRVLLKRCTDITFGRYIGETAEDEGAANNLYRAMFGGNPLPNELISREQMQERPPHILLTNYAMLEYLLLRPDDSPFFDGRTAEHWKFIVMDEVHTYDGTKGMETALLLRRLRERIQRGRSSTSFQCIATSATLGSDTDTGNIKQFADNLFSTNDRSSWELVKAETLNIDAHQPPDGFADYDKVTKLRQQLKDGPKTVIELANHLFVEEANASDKVRTLVERASQTQYSDGTPLLRARYHYFVKAMEGGFVSYYPEKRFFVKRREKTDADANGEQHPVFEAATCTNCGSLYLVGEEAEVGQHFRQTQKIDDDNRDKSNFYLVEETSEAADLQQDDDGEDQTLMDSHWLNTKTGIVVNRNSDNCIKIRGVALNEERRVKQCPVCQKQQSVLRFLLGKDAPASVLLTSLYEHLEPMENLITQITDAFGNPIEPTRSKKTIAFSDSRQDAAFFAPFIEDTFNRIVRRRLILEVIKQNKDDIQENGWMLSDYEIPLCKLAKDYDAVMTESGSPPTQQELKNTVWKWLLAEVMAVDGENSLERLGFVRFEVSEKSKNGFDDHMKASNFRLPSPLDKLRSKYLLSDEDIRNLFQALFDIFRLKAAITLPNQVPSLDDDRIFPFVNRTTEFTNTNGNGDVKNWFPSPGRVSLQSDLFGKIIQKITEDRSSTDIKELLEGFWKLYNNLTLILSKTSAGNLQLKYECIKMIPLNLGDTYYRCKQSEIITHRNIAGISPIFRYNSELEAFGFDTEQDPLKDNHYRRLYREAKPERLRAEEHSAQLQSSVAAKVQQHFIEGKINLLSCSTTFELGVDVGSLESVFLKNVPPTPANYVQRAGRAGRRQQSTAFVLTFCQRRSHDLYHFRDPIRVIKGQITVPSIQIVNEKIVRRHLHSVALAEFWKSHRQFFGTMESFFLGGNVGEIWNNTMQHKLEKGQTAQEFTQHFLSNVFWQKHPIRTFLNGKPDSIVHAANKIVPEEMRDDVLGSDGWKWLADFIGSTATPTDNNGILYKLAAKFYGTIAELEQRRIELFQQGKKSDWINHSQTTFKSRQFIAEAARFGVMPKYGFPVDVVELEMRGEDEISKKLDLSRDMKVALSEYAPGSELIAVKKVWTSWGIKLVPGRKLEEKEFKICSNCSAYESRAKLNNEVNFRDLPCKTCKETEYDQSGIFLYPEFGFVAKNQSERFSGKRPEKTYITQVFFASVGTPVLPLPDIQKNGLILKATSFTNAELGVINKSKFRVCLKCGYAEVERKSPSQSHKTHYGAKCQGTLSRKSLGYEFKTDVLRLEVSGINETAYTSEEQYDRRLSILYALIEGAAKALGITRTDVDGCLPSSHSDSFIIYDNVPGGAGYTRRLCDPILIEKMLEEALQHVESCGCGGENGDSSCYSCLQNYQNQFYHDNLKRKYAIEFFRQYAGQD